jgi:hypothetical protein
LKSLNLILKCWYFLRKQPLFQNLRDTSCCHYTYTNPYKSVQDILWHYEQAC